MSDSTPDELLQHLQDDLQAAIQVEHATIPVYFSAWVTMRTPPSTDGTQHNVAAERILRSVLIEEMLHLTQAANLLIAVGGTPNLTAPGFTLDYPGSLPGSLPAIPVSIQRFSIDALKVFCNIERPVVPSELPDDRAWGTIAQFYESIAMQYQHVLALFPELLSENLGRQVAPSAYYGAGTLWAIATPMDAQLAIKEIIDQGEGAAQTVFDDDHAIYGSDGREPAHYYRFLQLLLRRQYQTGDTPASGPSGPALSVDFDAVNPMRANASYADYAGHPEIIERLDEFNRLYGALLTALESAFNGGGSTAFATATATMFALGDVAATLTRTPDPTSPGETVGLVFAPIFDDR
jgi:hypothetical protein